MGKPAEIKTKPSGQNIDAFLDSLPDEQQRNDCKAILRLMEKATGDKPEMWGDSLIGFGRVVYKSPATGREVEWFKMGLSPRKAQISLHLMDVKKHEDSLTRLGKHKTGAGCLYIRKLEDVDMKVLQEIISDTVK